MSVLYSSDTAFVDEDDVNVNRSVSNIVDLVRSGQARKTKEVTGVCGNHPTWRYSSPEITPPPREIPPEVIPAECSNFLKRRFANRH